MQALFSGVSVVYIFISSSVSESNNWCDVSASLISRCKAVHSPVPSCPCSK